MTPAIDRAKKAKIAYTIHEYTHDPATESYGREAADKLGVDPARVFKTLVVAAGDGLVVAVGTGLSSFVAAAITTNPVDWGEIVALMVSVAVGYLAKNLGSDGDIPVDSNG